MENYLMLPSDNYLYDLNKSAKAFIDKSDWVKTIDTLSMMMRLDGTNINEVLSNLETQKMKPETVSAKSVESNDSINASKPVFNAANENASSVKNFKTDDEISDITNDDIDEHLKDFLTTEPQHLSIYLDAFRKKFGSKFKACDTKLSPVKKSNHKAKTKYYERVVDRYQFLKSKGITAHNTRGMYSLTESYVNKVKNTSDDSLQPVSY